MFYFRPVIQTIPELMLMPLSGIQLRKQYVIITITELIETEKYRKCLRVGTELENSILNIKFPAIPISDITRFPFCCRTRRNHVMSQKIQNGGAWKTHHLRYEKFVFIPTKFLFSSNEGTIGEFRNFCNIAVMRSFLLEIICCT